MDADKLARLFHDTYERLAPQYGYETRDDTKQFDPTTPNGKLMVAVAGEVDKHYQREITKARIDEAKDIRKNIEDLGTPVYFALQRIDGHIAELSQTLKEYKEE